MSASASASAPSRTIDVIVSIHENEPAIQLKFLFERLNWDHLVSFIQSSSTVEPPVVLYYKLAFDAPVEALESQEHLSQLLSTLGSSSPSFLRFYGHPDHVVSPVFVSSTAAFARLGALVDQHKHALKSNFHLARWVGFLASMMAVSSDRSFEHEFQALESFIQREEAKRAERRSGGRHGKNRKAPVETDGVISAGEDEEFAESPIVLDLDARLDGLDINGRPEFRRGGPPGFGFGGPGRHGHPLSPGLFEAYFNGSKDDKPEMDLKTRQAFAQLFRARRHHHRHHHHDRPHPPHGGPSSDSEGETGFGKFGGGRHHRHHHHGRPHPYGGHRSFGGPFGGPFPFDAPSDSDEDIFGPRRGKHFGGRGGRGGRGPFGFAFGPRGGAPPAFDSDEEFFGCRGFGGPGFGGRHGLGGRHGFGKHGKHHNE